MEVIKAGGMEEEGTSRPTKPTGTIMRRTRGSTGIKPRRDRSLDHLIRPQQQRLRNGEPEDLRGLEVDHQLELRGLLDWKVTGLGTLEETVDVDSHTPRRIQVAATIRHQSARLSQF